MPCSRGSVAVSNSQNRNACVCRFFRDISNWEIIAGKGEENNHIAIGKLAKGSLGLVQICQIDQKRIEGQVLQSAFQKFTRNLGQIVGVDKDAAALRISSETRTMGFRLKLEKKSAKDKASELQIS